MQKLGTISLVQIQREPMKTGEGQARMYRTDALFAVSSLKASPKGFHGIDETGKAIIDVHHEDHPRTRFRGDNRLSFGFTHYYDELRQRFGSHLQDGFAGENMIIMSDHGVSIPQHRRVMIQHKNGEQTYLSEIIPAPPCREFSIFCAQRVIDGAELKETLQFLDNGRRGYYATLADAGECLIKVGDDVFLV